MCYLFKTDIIKDRTDNIISSCGEAIVINRIVEYPRWINLYLYAKIDEFTIASIETQIDNNTITIDEFQSRYSRRGNGTKLFEILIDYIYQINTIYPIKRIKGYLTRFNFDRWEGLIYFYSHLSNYINSRYSNMRLDFKLRDYELSDFKDNLSNYKGNDIHFNYYITYP
ncbi:MULTISPECIES: hypothetical protein [Ruminococcus]|uniref:Uncharacterized protein n=1 Tax=Ruminococcus flavefaciens TaxID=1265 RepID=A0A1M7GPJ5_RUMFL|nr:MULTISPECIES: hypothetical protein [Ruminococcus]MCR4795826.1 hypothetical protein [Ruminococcus sp.]SHM18314.1 hypothetical protein SAMN04487860_101426 [Ruminococcus flavefaciens]